MVVGGDEREQSTSNAGVEVNILADGSLRLVQVREGDSLRRNGQPNKAGLILLSLAKFHIGRRRRGAGRVESVVSGDVAAQREVFLIVQNEVAGGRDALVELQAVHFDTMLLIGGGIFRGRSTFVDTDGRPGLQIAADSRLADVEPTG